MLVLSLGMRAETAPPGGPLLAPPPPVMEARVEGEALWITWRNPDLRATYFMAGGMLNMSAAATQFRFRARWKGKDWEVIDRSVPGVIAGRIDPWIVTLPHGAEYRFRIWLRELAIIEQPPGRGRWWSLGSLSADEWTLEISFTALEGFVPNTPYPRWAGRLTARVEFKPGGGKPAGK